MASEADKSGKANDKSKKLTQEQVIGTFNRLRQEQKNLVTRMTEVEQELTEHSLVVDALRDVDPERVCYRMVGGVLVERTVNNVLPAVAHNREQLSQLLDVINNQIVAKGKEINEFKEKYNIQFRKDPPLSISEPPKEEPAQASSSSILVKTES